MHGVSISTIHIHTFLFSHECRTPPTPPTSGKLLNPIAAQKTEAADSHSGPNRL